MVRRYSGERRGECRHQDHRRWDASGAAREHFIRPQYERDFYRSRERAPRLRGFAAGTKTCTQEDLYPREPFALLHGECLQHGAVAHARWRAAWLDYRHGGGGALSVAGGALGGGRGDDECLRLPARVAARRWRP